MFLLHELVRTRDNTERLVALLEDGGNPNFRDHEGNTALHILASKNEVNPQDIEENIKLAKLFVDYRSDVNLQNDAGKTPLIFAVKARNCRMTNFLLEANAQINVKDSDGNATLHYATLQCGSSLQNDEFIRDPVLQLVRALVKPNTVFDIRNALGQTPLMLAVKNQDLQVVKVLLDQKLALDLTDEDNNTALHHAFDQEHVDLDIVLELARRGNRFDIPNLMDLEPIPIYINKLFDAPAEELENAKTVFKLCLLLHEFYKADERQALERISRDRNCQLFQFLEHCTNEIRKMIHDKLFHHYTVHNIALRGVYGIKDKPQIPMEVFERVLKKLMDSEYPVYRDVIASGIYDKFMKEKFAETVCFLGNASSDNLNFTIFYKVSRYLSSHMDMLNFMLACSPDKRNRGPFSVFKRCFKPCSGE